MSQTIDLIFGVTGQSIYFDAPEGRASSVVSSTVYENSTGDDGTAESATTGSAAVETDPSTTFDAASGAGQDDPRICRITATTGVSVGRTYLVTNATGEKEWVEVQAISSGAHVVARKELENAYTTADTFVSTRISHAIDATWVADRSNLSGAFDPNPKYRWRIVYVVNSVTCVADVYFDLLRYQGRHTVRPEDVDRHARGWMERVATEDREDQGRATIDEAWRIVKMDMYGMGIPDTAIRSREVVDDLVILKATELVDANEMTMRRYAERVEQLVQMGRVAMSQSSSAAASPGVITSKFEK